MGHPCPNCGLEREFSATLAGLRVCCRGCNHFFDLPRDGHPADPAPARFTVPPATDPPNARPVLPPSERPVAPSPDPVPIDPAPDLASRLARLGACLIDTGLIVGALLGGMFAGALVYPVEDEDDLTGAVLQDARSATTSTGLLAVSLVFVLNVVLLSVRGQSVGKWLLRVRIVSDRDGDPVGFLRGFLLRDGVTLLIKMVPLAGTIYVWIDSLFIFNAERRCLHDLIAGTRVVEVMPEGSSDYRPE